MMMAYVMQCRVHVFSFINPGKGKGYFENTKKRDFFFLLQLHLLIELT
jgi:hypothetical protein